MRFVRLSKCIPHSGQSNFLALDSLEGSSPTGGGVRTRPWRFELLPEAPAVPVGGGGGGGRGGGGTEGGALDPLPTGVPCGDDSTVSQ